jgi:hypothetical protein
MISRYLLADRDVKRRTALDDAVSRGRMVEM